MFGQTVSVYQFGSPSMKYTIRVRNQYIYIKNWLFSLNVFSILGKVLFYTPDYYTKNGLKRDMAAVRDVRDYYVGKASQM